MGIEEEKQVGEAVFGFEGVVVQEPVCGVPPVLVLQWLGVAAPAEGGDVVMIRACKCGILPGRATVKPRKITLKGAARHP